jgi:hypothetical protein
MFMLTKIGHFFKKFILWSIVIGLAAFVTFVVMTLIMYGVKDKGVTTLNKPYIEIPYRYNSTGHIVIDVEVKGKIYPFIMDSGASNMLFSQFGVEDDGFRFFGFGVDSNGAPFFPMLKKMNQFRIGQISFSDFTFSQMKPHFVHCFEDGVGLIGKEAMRHYVWQFFPEEQIIRISNELSETTQSFKADTVDCTVGKFGYHLNAMVKIDTDSTARFKKSFVDLGFNGSWTIPFDSSMITLPRVESIGSNGKGLASANESTTWFSRTNQLQIGDFSYDKNMDFMVTQRRFKAIGIGFLKAFNFTLDWKGSRLILDPLPDKDVKIKWFGINLDWKEGEGVIVGSIIENSKADSLSITPGTPVRLVNDRSSYDFSDKCELSQHIKASDSLTISYIQGGQEKSAWFTKYYYLGE